MDPSGRRDRAENYSEALRIAATRPCGNPPASSSPDRDSSREPGGSARGHSGGEAAGEARNVERTEAEMLQRPGGDEGRHYRCLYRRQALYREQVV